jgi:hypothetical protein
MKSVFPLLLAAVLCVWAAPWVQAAAPFSLTVVPSKSQAPPGGRFISMADEKADVFHVVLTNVSKEVQPVFETWNSWGYQAISFELTLRGGRKTIISVSDQDFTRNFPSTFHILPGEHQVFPIRLDKTWEMNPKVALGSETLVTLKAIYEVVESPESRANHIWAGRVESNACQLTVRHW